MDLAADCNGTKGISYQGSIISVFIVPLVVIPAKAGIQDQLKRLESRFHGNDRKKTMNGI